MSTIHSNDGWADPTLITMHSIVVAPSSMPLHGDTTSASGTLNSVHQTKDYRALWIVTTVFTMTSHCTNFSWNNESSLRAEVYWLRVRKVTSHSLNSSCRLGLLQSPTKTHISAMRLIRKWADGSVCPRTLVWLAAVDPHVIGFKSSYFYTTIPCSMHTEHFEVSCQRNVK